MLKDQPERVEMDLLPTPSMSSVTNIPDNRMADGGELRPDLMIAPGFELDENARGLI